MSSNDMPESRPVRRTPLQGRRIGGGRNKKDQRNSVYHERQGKHTSGRRPSETFDWDKAIELARKSGNLPPEKK